MSVPLILGNIELDMPVFQAPLSGYTDFAMRQLGRDFGCKLTFAGLMLAKSAAHPKVLRKIHDGSLGAEYPLGGQLLGRDSHEMIAGGKALLANGFDLIDLNFACPARKVLMRGRGGALLREPELAIQIFKDVRREISCPLLIKLRAGYGTSEKSKNSFLQICEAAAEYGAEAVVVHGRTVTQKYRGKADWKIIADVKRRLERSQTKVVGSGDLFSGEDVKNRLEQTGIDGVIIARGAIGNPWIYDQIRASLNNQPQPERPTVKQVGQVMDRHLEMILRIFASGKAVGYFRKFAVHYCKFHPERKDVQADFMGAKHIEELKNAIEKWFNK